MTYRELGQELSLSIRYLQKCVKQGALPHIRFGRAVRFDPNAISAWVNQHNNTSKTYPAVENLP